MRILRWFLVLLFLAALGLGAAYYIAGKAEGPAIVINQPGVIGQDSPLEVTIDAPGVTAEQIDLQLEQGGRSFPLLSPQREEIVRESGERLVIKGKVGRKWQPELKSGTATIRVAASRPVLRDLRRVSSSASKEVQVRLEPPRVGVVSTHHYINVGGSEMIVYRVSPADVESGVRVGSLSFPGFAATGAGLKDSALKVAFFSLPYDTKGDPPMELIARDIAGNEARAQFEHRVFPKTFRSSRIPLDDKFLSRVVPAILAQSPSLGAPEDLLPAFLKINRDLRRINNEKIASLARQSAPSILWDGAFQGLGGSAVESAFADFRTYIYAGKEVDRQVHLGFDLAKTANAPVTAANNGKVMFAADLGIYGNCIILDHGMGVQSLYGHLSSFDVHEGEDVKKGQTLGKSGQTGLAGGDHLHFSMLVNGQFVNATEWWDPHWIEDRILRKLRE
jgi:murein DD-endopeptidase MepM/ murein hydrolase activator NlpD